MAYFDKVETQQYSSMSKVARSSLHKCVTIPQKYFTHKTVKNISLVKAKYFVQLSVGGQQ